MTASLSQMNLGQRARVDEITGDDHVVQRLLEMGLLEEEIIEVIGVAPLGDPITILLRDYRLSLRRAEASCVRVSIL